MNNCNCKGNYHCFECSPPVKTVLAELSTKHDETSIVSKSIIELLAKQIADCQRHCDNAGICFVAFNEPILNPS